MYWLSSGTRAVRTERKEEKVYPSEETIKVSAKGKDWSMYWYRIC